LAYIERIILPYVQQKQGECGLPNEQHAICIFDNFKAQVTDKVLKLLEDNNVDAAYFPDICTDCLQPTDLSVNKPMNDFLNESLSCGILTKCLSKEIPHPLSFPCI